MKTFEEFNNSVPELSESEVADLKLNEDRMQKELMQYCDNIKNNMKDKNWNKALADAKNLVKILEMVI